MERSVEGSILARLERAELAARERRLAAEAEAERILEAAGATVGGIDAGVPARIATALAELRARHIRRAHDEVAAIEAELAELELNVGNRPQQEDWPVDSGPAEAPVDSGPAEAPIDHGAFESAVQLVVAAVLGES